MAFYSITNKFFESRSCFLTAMGFILLAYNMLSEKSFQKFLLRLGYFAFLDKVPNY